jgi:UDP-N-acetyl-2-amino-2-deoxyglucuronate dehydrogenase
MAEVGFGIIGCGVIAPIHAEALKDVPGARLIAVSDVMEKNAVAMAEKYGVQPYTDYIEMIRRPDIHAVSLCVPSGMRMEIAEICAAAGKHILSEKPLEVTTERIDRIISATNANKVKLGCIFQSRFADGPNKIHTAIEQGRFGRIVLGDAYIKWFRSAEYYKSGAWRGTRKLDGGGVLMNQGIHQIDLMLWFLGKPVSVFAKTALVAHEDLEVEDLACAIIKFESGAMGVVEGSTAIWPGHSARVEVHGTEGSAVLEDGELRFWQFKNERDEDKAIQAGLNKAADLGSGAADPIKGLKHEGHRRQIDDFTRAIQEGREPAIVGREGRRAVEIIQAIYRSAESGNEIKL